MKFNVENKTKKKKEKQKKYYIKLLDKWWADSVKTRDDWKCVRYGRKHGEITKTKIGRDKETKEDKFRFGKVILTAAHIFSRTIMELKYVIDNGVSMCYKCHFTWQPNAPIEFTFMIIKLKGLKLLMDLFKRSKLKREYTIEEYIKMCRDRNLLKEKLND